MDLQITHLEPQNREVLVKWIRNTKQYEKIAQARQQRLKKAIESHEALVEFTNELINQKNTWL